MRARELKPGHRVLHSGDWHTVADVETRYGVTRVATMVGGHIAYCAGMWVSVRTGAMKKGQIVKCISVTHVREGKIPHLTNGRNYTIVSGEGDRDWEGRVITSPAGFEVVCDYRCRIFCVHPECAHATWGLVQ